MVPAGPGVRADTQEESEFISPRRVCKACRPCPSPRGLWREGNDPFLAVVAAQRQHFATTVDITCVVRTHRHQDV